MSIASLYRKIVPQSIRVKIYSHFLGPILSFSRAPIDIKRDYIQKRIKYYFNKPKTEEEKAWKTWANKPISPYPYRWEREYTNLSINVLSDSETGLPYVLHQNKKLYFRRKTSTETIKACYRALLIEQDSRSAHCYLENKSILKGKTLLDIGCAEGIIALENIEQLDSVYLFECEPSWIEALTATFKPYSNKVKLIPKYVSNINDENNITLSSMLDELKDKDLFIKMDIEGYETAVLNSSSDLFKLAKAVSGSICTYHTHNDADTIENILQSYGMQTQFQPGFLYFQKEMRKAVIRFTNR